MKKLLLTALTATVIALFGCSNFEKEAINLNENQYSSVDRQQAPTYFKWLYTGNDIPKWTCPNTGKNCMQEMSISSNEISTLRTTIASGHTSVVEYFNDETALANSSFSFLLDSECADFLSDIQSGNYFCEIIENSNQDTGILEFKDSNDDLIAIGFKVE